MTDDQRVHYNMAGTVVIIMEDNNSIWSAHAPIVAKKAALDAKLTAIEADLDAQGINNTGISDDKAESRNSLIQKLIVAAGCIESYARDTANRKLQNDADIIKSTLETTDEADFIRIAKRINTIGTANITAINTGGYGIANTDLVAIASGITDFKSWRNKPRAAEVATSHATMDMERHFTELATLLDDLDEGMKRYIITNYAFYEMYTIARQLVNQGSTPNAQTFNINVAATGGMADVPATIFSPGRSISITIATGGGPIEASFGNTQGTTTPGQPMTSIPGGAPFTTTCGAMGYTTAMHFLTLINNTPNPVDVVVVVG